mmetsp:Transcript_11762/g.33515  ORF Transcript_11762/g.33515 Transcript_11762/m.33515 type:complete len:219 (-) Transcript_11762:554-1210(-)
MPACCCSSSSASSSSVEVAAGDDVASTKISSRHNTTLMSSHNGSNSSSSSINTATMIAEVVLSTTNTGTKKHLRTKHTARRTRIAAPIGIRTSSSIPSSPRPLGTTMTMMMMMTITTNTKGSLGPEGRNHSGSRGGGPNHNRWTIGWTWPWTSRSRRCGRWIGASIGLAMRLLILQRIYSSQRRRTTTMVMALLGIPAAEEVREVEATMPDGIIRNKK